MAFRLALHRSTSRGGGLSALRLCWTGLGQSWGLYNCAQAATSPNARSRSGSIPRAPRATRLETQALSGCGGIGGGLRASRSITLLNSPLGNHYIMRALRKWSSWRAIAKHQSACASSGRADVRACVARSRMQFPEMQHLRHSPSTRQFCTSTLPLAATSRKRTSAGMAPTPCPHENSNPALVSVIVAARNAELYLDACFESVIAQSYSGPIELSVHVDGGADGTLSLCRRWEERVNAKESDSRFSFVLSESADSHGAGAARNRAIEQSSGRYLCIQDADDVSEPSRIAQQLIGCQQHREAIVGSRFTRIPLDATPRYASWLNGLTQDQLMLHRFRELTIIQPTWFMRRAVWVSIGSRDSFCATVLSNPSALLYSLHCTHYTHCTL
jgi:hypothetical protein